MINGFLVFALIMLVPDPAAATAGTCLSALTEGTVRTAERLLESALQKGILEAHDLIALRNDPKRFTARKTPTASSLPYLTALQRVTAGMSNQDADLFLERVDALIESHRQDEVADQLARTKTKNIFIPKVVVPAMHDFEITFTGERLMTAYVGGSSFLIREHVTLAKNSIQIIDPFAPQEKRIFGIDRNGGTFSAVHVFSIDGKPYATGYDFLTFVDLEKRSDAGFLFAKPSSNSAGSRQNSWLANINGIPMIAKAVKTQSDPNAPVTIQYWPLLRKDSSRGSRQLDLGLPNRYGIFWSDSHVIGAIYPPERGDTFESIRFFDLESKRMLSKLPLSANISLPFLAHPHFFEMDSSWQAVMPMDNGSAWTLAVADPLGRNPVYKLENFRFTSIEEIGSIDVEGSPIIYAAVSIQASQFLVIFDPRTKETAMIESKSIGQIEKVHFEDRALLLWPNGSDGFSIFDVGTRHVISKVNDRDNDKRWTQIVPFIHENELFAFATRQLSPPIIFKLSGERP